MDGAGVNADDNVDSHDYGNAFANPKAADRDYQLGGLSLTECEDLPYPFSEE